MRIILCFLLCGLPLAIWAQSAPKVKLKVYNAFCIPEVPSYPTVIVSLFRMPEDTLVFRSSQSETTGEVIDEGILEPGRYVARYKNPVGQQLEKEILLGLKDTAIGFCMDSLQSYPQNTLAKFKDKDSLMLIVTYTGGTSGDIVNKIVIKRHRDVLTASLFVMAYEDMSDSLAKTVVMDDSMKTAFVRFENELSLVEQAGNDSWGATVYSIACPYLNMSKEVAPMSWSGGFYVLCHIFFDKRE